MGSPQDGVTRTETEAPEDSAGGSDPAPFAATEAAPREDPSEIREDRSGETIGRFRLASKLGEGGMGVVYAAEDLRLGRTVALKILSREAVRREDRRKRFLREARAASAVLHPNIAAIFEVGEEDGEVFLAMEHVAGRTLRKALRERGGPLPLARALSIARDIATGLGKAHAAGIVHRDLKPENVMLTPEGQVKILDFGLAKRLSGGEPASPPTGDLATMEGQILGTVGYMSPEQALGEEVDLRTDLFSLGVILYEMLTGSRPFGGETRMATLIATHRDPAAPPSSRSPGVPASVDALVMRCLEKAREARFQSAEELEKALAGALREAESGAERARTARGPRAPVPGPRSKEIAMVGASAAGLVVLAVGVLWAAGWLSLGTGGAGGETGAPSPPATGTSALAVTGTLGAATTGTLAPAATPVLPAPGSASAPAPVVPRRPCLAEDAGKKACSGADSVAWCDPDGRPVGCCGKGLVPKGTDGICVCPPGGTAVPSALARGCAAPAADYDARYAKAKGEAMQRSIECFKPSTLRNSIAGGTFESEYYLTPEGDVFGARVHRTTMPDDEGQACAVAAIRAIRFPPPPGEEAGKKQGFGFVFKE